MPLKEFPILEHDEDKNAFITPSIRFKPIEIPEKCVICFFSDAIETILTEYPSSVIAGLKYESLRLPIYELIYNHEKIVLVQGAEAAPLAARQIDELTALGCKKYIACGSCGVLQEEIAVGHLIIPISAVRDEGTSYHYMPPSREVAADERIVSIIEDTLLEKKVPYIKAKTWTTDAPYRETPSKIKQRREEGCVSVEMEAAAFMAVAKYNHVEFGQILYAGDNLSGEKWDGRDYRSRIDIREFVLRLALDACLKM